MKIVQVCPYDMQRPGGVQTHIRDLSNWFRAQGHDVLIVAPPAFNDVTEDGVVTLGNSRSIAFQGTGFEISFASPKAMNKLKKSVQDFGADVMHIHTPWTPMLTWQVWRACKLPTVVTFHATLPTRKNNGLENRILHRIARYFIRRTSLSIVPSQSPLQQIEKLADGKDVTIIPPTVDLSPWKNSEVKSDNQAVNLLFLGRLEERKGVDDLLAAWDILEGQFQDMTLTIAGGGAMEAEVKAAVSRQPKGRLKFVPNPDQTLAHDLMAKADLFIAPSKFGESFGIVLIEAMAAGAVPIAAANSGYVTVMTNLGKQALYSPGDRAGLVDVISKLATDFTTRTALRQWGFTQARQFDVTTIGPKYAQIFQKALADTTQ